jgi:hypothetical protein
MEQRSRTTPNKELHHVTQSFEGIGAKDHTNIARNQYRVIDARRAWDSLEDFGTNDRVCRKGTYGDPEISRARPPLAERAAHSLIHGRDDEGDGAHATAQIVNL